MRIPRIIHFIWAGGDTEMPKSYEDSARLWLSQNPNFEKWMWVDKKSSADPNFINDTDQSYFKKTFGNAVQLKDIEEEKISDEYIRYEIEKPKPNYGGSSDLLRYKILFEFGGAYFDFDIDPGNVSLTDSSIFNKDYDAPFLYTHESQNTDFEGNDALICTPKNPRMLEMYKIAISHYTLRYNKNFMLTDNEIYNVLEFNSPEMIAYFSEDKNYIRGSTPIRTGPLCTRLVTRHSPESISLDKDCCNIIKFKTTYRVIANMNPPPFNGCFPREATITIPFDINGEEWIKTKVIEIDLSELIRRIAATIKFEFEKLGVLRLDDHVSHIKKLLLLEAEQSYDKKAALASQAEIKAINDILLIIEELNLEHFLCIQLTFQYQGTIDYCFRKQLLEKTFLFPLSDHCKDLAFVAPYYERALCAVMRVNLFNELIFLLNRDRDRDKSVIEAEIDSAASFCFKFLAYILEFSNLYFEKTIYVDLSSLENYFEKIITCIDQILTQLNLINNRFKFSRYINVLTEFNKWKEIFNSLRTTASVFSINENNLESRARTISISPFSLFYKNKITINENQNKTANDINFPSSDFKSACN
jgi:hypothetical protein